MSNALVPAGASSSPAFVNQGTVDWTALSRSTISFTVEVAARLSKAGIDTLTIGMGRALCASINLRPEAQKRVEDALKRLKAFSSYGKVIWLGFGIRHIIWDLRETEQGLACVGLCACLMTNYNTWYGAQVLRALCSTYGAPKELTPSLHQWQALLRSCSGILGASCLFLRRVETFASLLAASSPRRSGISVHEPTLPEIVAESLRSLCDISCGKLEMCSYTGGVDCAWIAAVAEWLLCLDVELYVRDEKTGTLTLAYRSGTAKRTGAAQVTIYAAGAQHAGATATGQAPNATQSSLILAKVHVLMSGKEFIAEGVAGDSPGPRGIFQRRASWSKLLGDTFGERIMGELLNGKNAVEFAQLLWTVAYHPDVAIFIGAEVVTRSVKFFLPAGTLIFGRQNSQRGILRGIGGEDFLQFAAKGLPELAPVIESIQPPEDAVNTALEFIEKKERCLHNLYINMGDKEMENLPLFLVELLCLLVYLRVHEELLPSVTGLRSLYNTCKPHRSLSERSATLNFKETDRKEYYNLGLHLSHTLFSGHKCGPAPPDGGRDPGTAAISTYGICSVYRIIETMDLPPAELPAIQVLAGSIEYDGQQYDAAIDGDMAGANTKEIPVGNVPVRLVATESSRVRMLEVNWQAKYSPSSGWCSIPTSHLSSEIYKIINFPGPCSTVAAAGDDPTGFKLEIPPKTAVSERARVYLQQHGKCEPGTYDSDRWTLLRLDYHKDRLEAYSWRPMESLSDYSQLYVHAIHSTRRFIGMVFSVPLPLTIISTHGSLECIVNYLIKSRPLSLNEASDYKSATVVISPSPKDENITVRVVYAWPDPAKEEAGKPPSRTN